MQTKLDDILDGKLTDVNPDLVVGDGKEHGIKTPDNDNPEITKDGTDPKDKKQETKESATHDESGLLLMKNSHIHGIAQNLHGTMHAVDHMQGTMDKMLTHLGNHTKQTKLHEDVLVKNVGAIARHEEMLKQILDHLNKK